MEEQTEACLVEYMKIGITRGNFVILTAGHVKMLQQASCLVDKLYVLLDADVRTQEQKGAVYVPDVHRRAVLSGLRSVHDCYRFETEEEFQRIVGLILDINVRASIDNDLGQLRAVYFKGGDYKPSDLPEREFLEGLGFAICCLGHSGHSTTEIVNRIKNG